MRISDWSSDVCSSDLGVSAGRAGSDLADQVQRRRQRLGAFLPLRRADFTRMRGGVLGSLELAQGFRHVAGDLVGMDFQRLDDAFRIDDEGAAQREAFLFDMHIEGVRHLVRRIADQRELGLANRRRGFMRSEEHKSELQSLMRISYAVLLLKKKKKI